MTQTPLVISFYILRTSDEEKVKRLKGSCEKYGIEAEIVGVEPEMLKPFFILEKLRKHDRPILWVDADAVFKQRPDFNELGDCDLSVRMNEFLPKGHAARILSGTVFVRNNPAGAALLEQWCQETQRNEKDPTALQEVLNRNECVRFFPLPLKYAKTFHFDDLFISEKEVVIEHGNNYASPSHHCCH